MITPGADGRLQSRNASGTMMGIFTDNPPILLLKRKGPTGGKPRGPKVESATGKSDRPHVQRSRPRLGDTAQKVGALPKKKASLPAAVARLVVGRLMEICPHLHPSMVVLAAWRYPSTDVKLRGPLGSPRPLH